MSPQHLGGRVPVSWRGMKLFSCVLKICTCTTALLMIYSHTLPFPFSSLGLQDQPLIATSEAFSLTTMQSTSEQLAYLEDLEALKIEAIRNYLSMIGTKGGAANKGKPGRSEIARRAAIARNLKDPGWQARIVRSKTAAAL